MKLRVAATACILVAGAAFAQTAPAFEAASVRQSRAGAAQHSNVPLDAGNVYGAVSADDARTAAGGYFVATHQALWRYISFAYALSGTQELALRFNVFAEAPKAGAPAWVTGSFTEQPEYFDISARAPAETSIDGLRLMMRTLLLERFQLAMRYQDADVPVFALVPVTPGLTGPNLRPHAMDDLCPVPGESGTAAAVRLPAAGEMPPVCGVVARVASAEPGQHYGGWGVPLALVATSVPTITGLAAMPRPVVDETGLGGPYDFWLSWAHDAAGGEAAVAENADNFRAALKKQLGLALKPARARLRFLVVEHVERPSDN